MKKTPILHPFFFAVYAILGVYAQNPQELPVRVDFTAPVDFDWDSGAFLSARAQMDRQPPTRGANYHPGTCMALFGTPPQCISGQSFHHTYIFTGCIIPGGLGTPVDFPGKYLAMGKDQSTRTGHQFSECHLVGGYSFASVFRHCLYRASHQTDRDNKIKRTANHKSGQSIHHQRNAPRYLRYHS